MNRNRIFLHRTDVYRIKNERNEDTLYVFRLSYQPGFCSKLGFFDFSLWGIGKKYILSSQLLSTKEMKIHYIILGLFYLLAIVACSDNDPVVEVNNGTSFFYLTLIRISIIPIFRNFHFNNVFEMFVTLLPPNLEQNPGW